MCLVAKVTEIAKPCQIESYTYQKSITLIIIIIPMVVQMAQKSAVDTFVEYTAPTDSFEPVLAVNVV